LTLVPLFLGVFRPEEPFRKRIDRAVREHPDVAGKLGENADVDEFLEALPGGRLEGAIHSRSTGIHWVYGGAAALGFWGLLLLLFPLGRANSRHLWIIGLLVGTVGILLLLGFQWLAFHMPFRVIGINPMTVIIYVLWLIGYSYAAAMDPSSGFFSSLAGFTFGVGLCEEFVKLLPLLLCLRRGVALDLRGAVAWGMAMGIGFGVSEAIHYAGAYYNGIYGAEVYFIRFISCVSLHTVWSGLAAALAWSRREEFEAPEKWYGILIPAVFSIGGSMVLHGVYDTLLKRELDVLAFVAALASFAAFFWVASKKVEEERQAILRPS
jgi:RsiW-degrading membrane proteinase PrsW (M82 family)